jgi:hypothetical protein
MLKEYLLLMLVGFIGACAQFSARTPAPKVQQQPAPSRSRVV